MDKFLQTGIEGLDRVLCGGFLYHNSILLKGAPGAGKTTLGIQMIHNGATLFGEPGIIVLFEQFPQQLFRDLMSYHWDLNQLAKAHQIRVIFSTPDQAVATDKLSEAPLISQIHDAALEIGARRILVDSVSHLLNLAREPHEGRELLLHFINSIKSIGLTPILTAEAEEREGAIGVDEYLSDCVLLLGTEGGRDKNFPVRHITIRKTRGHDHLRGRHVFRLTERGVEVYPRALAVAEDTVAISAEAAAARLVAAPSGVSGLDALLGDGYTRGASMLLAGLPGTFKTTLGAQFLACGARPEDKGLIVTFSEPSEFLARLMEQKGLPVRERMREGRLDIWHFMPKEIHLEELLARLDERMRTDGLTLLMVDGVNEIERAAEDVESCKDILSLMLSLCARRGVTSLFTQKIETAAGANPLAAVRYASLFDGIIYLGTIEIESAVRKVISVLKMRGAGYASDLREIACGSRGLQVLDKFVGMSGVLSGDARGQYKKTVEGLFQPLYFIRDFIEVLAAPDTPAEQKEMILQNLKTESNALVEKLKTHFDIKS